MAKEKLQILKNKLSSLGNNPLIESTESLSSMQSRLNNDKYYYNSYVSQNSAFTSELSQTKAKLSLLQQEQTNLQVQKSNQGSLVVKVNSYLTDFQNSSQENLSNDELMQKLVGELQQLNME
jgi:hypothetical protein